MITLELIEWMEVQCQTIAGKTTDYKEGVQAFLEKRNPNFKGK
tara:strand:- start:258 stop:386 length:129 start_codon:yes stop_codon:yes gene_type:complete